MPNYFIEACPERRVTARPRNGTEPAFGLPVGEEPDRSNPERSLAAAVLMLALQDASGRVYCPEGGPGSDLAIASEARAFLTAVLPSPWAKSRQRFTGLLGLDDECFRVAAERKLGKGL